MRLSIEVPEDIQAVLESRWGDLPAHVQETLAVEGYREGILSLAQVRRLLRLESRWDAQLFLGQRGVAVFDYELSELDREASLQRNAMNKPSPQAE